MENYTQRGRAWILQAFDNKAAMQRNGVFRRNIDDIGSNASLDTFLAEVQNREFKAILHEEQVVVLCGGGDISILL